MEVHDEPYRASSELVSSPCLTNDVARCESLKEALGLQLTLDDPDDTPGKKLFDLEQIHRTSSVVDRWVENLKSSAKRFECNASSATPLSDVQLVAIDKGFRADLKRIKTYSPGCKRQTKEHMLEIEDRFRVDHLMWLQQVEEVGEQFQELANDMQHKEACDKFFAMRAQQTKQRRERAQMMQLWMEDAKVFKQESNMAKEERRRLEKIHGKVHDRAKMARKVYPVCSESFRAETQLVKCYMQP